MGKMHMGSNKTLGNYTMLQSRPLDKSYRTWCFQYEVETWYILGKNSSENTSMIITMLILSGQHYTLYKREH